MTDGRKDILIIMGRYLPGYKDGGPVRSIKNLTDFLGREYNFKILTCDRDHGDTEPYPNIKVNNWNHVGNADVYYVPPKGFSQKLIVKLTKQVDLVYVCGCFNDYAINTLMQRNKVREEKLIKILEEEYHASKPVRFEDIIRRGYTKEMLEALYWVIERYKFAVNYVDMVDKDPLAKKKRFSSMLEEL